MTMVWRLFYPAIFVTALLSASSAMAALSTDLSPPRSVADIVAILDQQQPDPVRRAQQLAAAEAPEPPNADNRVLGRFLLERGVSLGVIGRQEASIADLERAIPLLEKVGDDSFRARMSLGAAYRLMGRPQDALRVFRVAASQIEKSRQLIGRLFPLYRNIIQSSVILGDMRQADEYTGYAEGMLKEIQGNPRIPGHLVEIWRAEVELSKGILAEGRGNHAVAERHFTVAMAGMNKSKMQAMERSSVFDSNMLMLSDTMLGRLGEIKLAQGRMREAEVDIRQALLSSLKNSGKDNATTGFLVARLGNLVLEQNRLPEAEKLYRTALEIFKQVGQDEDSETMVTAQRDIGYVLLLRRNWSGASAQFEEAAALTSRWMQRRSNKIVRDPGRILALARSGQGAAAVDLAARFVELKSERFGEKHFDTAIAQGVYGIALSEIGRHAEAIKSFQAAMPILLSASRQAETEDSALATRDFFVQSIIEGYMVLLSKVAGTELASGLDTAAESFRLADAARGRAVQRALAASATRALTRDQRLADLVRNEQDSQKRIGAGFGLLGTLLALPPEQRDEKVLRDLRVELDRERTERARLRGEIERQFPDYVNLIDPRPPTAADIRSSLRPGEAFISFYLAPDVSFVWAQPQDGAMVFSAIPRGSEDIAATVAKLRLALEPQAETLGDIPPFDLALAHQLYADLLQPVEAGWKTARSLIVVSNGALGLLPLSLLPTTPPAAAKPAGKAPLFAEYKGVEWLARSHAVTQLPAASALKTLRSLGRGDASREPLIGFGDPLFNAEQAGLSDVAGSRIASADPVQVRGARLKRRNAPATFAADSAQLSDLPRLPDTAEELRSVAAAMRADPGRSLHFGKDANEAVVKRTNLTKYRVLAFATHGLVPGELDGLTQPALALSAPDVAGVEGDGLLDMEEILGLKLNADWVVLSACNTGTGSGAGAEAASGLGRAFFYAGTRALLLTNWSVHSASAKDLVTDLFRRQAEDAGLGRAEALRQAMLGLLDGPGYQEDGRSLFSYAHPIFWAPYSLMGDGA